MGAVRAGMHTEPTDSPVLTRPPSGGQTVMRAASHGSGPSGANRRDMSL